jgi:phenylacetate-coenzyme A ligase PaaK-like adenylate-forming protein
MKKKLQQLFLKQAFRLIRYQVHGFSDRDVNRQSMKRLFRCFRTAYQHSDAYRRIVNSALGSSPKIRSGFDVLKRVPIIDKNSFFALHPLRATHPMSISRLSGRIWSSSGSTNVLSLGFEAKSSDLVSLSIDFMLDSFFQTLTKRTVLLNCLSDCWPIPSKTMQVCNLGTRTDIGVSLLKRLSGDVDQFLLCMEPLLAKQLIEEAVKDGVDFGRTHVHFIIGGEYVSEHLRQYLHGLINPGSVANRSRSQNFVLLSMGMAEFGLSVFIETPAIAEMRRALFQSNISAQSIFGQSCSFAPQIFQYSPLSTFVESLDLGDGNPSLILSSLNLGADVPLIRYRTGDTGLIFSYDDMLHRFKKVGIGIPLPVEFPFPFVITPGRSTIIHRISRDGCDLSSVKETLYACRSLLPFITGYFFLSQHPEKKSHPINIQLKEGIAMSDIPKEVMMSAVDRLSSNELSTHFVPYFQFTTGMGHLFDRKFSFTIPSGSNRREKSK